MAVIPIKVAYANTDIEHVSMFDHLGRELLVTGYEGGLTYLSSDTLSQTSLSNLAHDAGLTEDTSPVAQPWEGDFGSRTGRRTRRMDYHG